MKFVKFFSEFPSLSGTLTCSLLQLAVFLLEENQQKAKISLSEDAQNFSWVFLKSIYILYA